MAGKATGIEERFEDLNNYNRNRFIGRYVGQI